jgi:S-DNA-T family DNA segregation ATPase FtsK/SpoIIIE
MAGKTRKKAPANPTFGSRNSEPRPFVGLFFLLFGILAALAIIDYSPAQNEAFHGPPPETNLIGIFGVHTAYASLQALGLAAYAVPLLGFWLSYMFFRPYAGRIRLRKLPPLFLLYASLAVFGTLYQVEEIGFPPGKVELREVESNFFPYGWGGWLGFWTYAQFLRNFLGMVGSLVVVGVISLFSLTILLFDNLALDARYLLRTRFDAWNAGREERKQLRAERREAAKEEKGRRREAARKAREEKRKAKKLPEKSPDKPLAEDTPAAQTEKREEVAPPPDRGRSLRIGGTKKKAPESESTPQPFAPILEEGEKEGASAGPESDGQEEESGDAVVGPPPGPTAPKKKETIKLGGNGEKKGGANLRIIAREEVRKAASALPEKKGDYRFPPMRLLSDPPAQENTDDEAVHQQIADTLVKTLEEFGVRVTPGDVHTGPVITRYDIYPAAGVRVERILNLDKNIALNLKAMSVRILAPVPGKGCVGIEVPNKNQQPVYIRDILESEDWVNNKAEIPIALGKDVSGRPLITDLAKMPHLLIAGSTGSGKTVCINSVITSLLYHSSPQDLRFVMIDPKIVEMQVYNKLPHMLVPVVTDPKKVPNALKYLLNEMERRYQYFAQAGVRNIAGYNAKMARDRKEAREAEERAAAMEADLTPEERAAAAAINIPRDPDAGDAPPDKLPYVVCIVDELADLMMVAPADIETGIARLAQLARAAGIHLILATQRPSVNVITGVIKANLPSRISFKVASRVDSRTILDTMGADHLIGKGDMLFLPPGSPDLIRSQGAFVSDEEINGIVDHIREANGEPQFDERFQQNLEAGDTEGDAVEGSWEDDLVPDAIEVIRTSKRASTSMLQRRLKIGYNRAARIMEILENEGMVGPENGSSPREILMDLE